MNHSSNSSADQPLNQASSASSTSLIHLNTTEHTFTIGSHQLTLPAEGLAYVNGVRNSPPSRRVQGHRNVTGLFPSRKMRNSIQHESGGIELAAIYRLEFDRGVLEYYDQPDSIVVSYEGEEGEARANRIFPDFLVIRFDRVLFLECKDAADLAKQAAKHPERFVCNELGQWRCPPAEAAAAKLGLGYEIVTTAQINPIYQSNLEFLHEHMRMAHPEVPTKIWKGILKVVRAQFAPTIATVLQLVESAKLPHILDMILSGEIVTDLESRRLAGANELRLFPSLRALKTFKDVLATEASTGLIHDLNLRLHEGDTFRFQDQIYTVYDRSLDSLTIGNEDGPAKRWRLADVQQMMAAGLIKSAPRQVKVDPERAEGASQEQWNEALKRLRTIRPHLDEIPVSCKRLKTTRSIRRWIKAYRWASDRHGWGILGLVSKPTNIGNRTRRFSKEVCDAMSHILENVYKTPKCKTQFLAYGALANLCKEKSLTAPSMRAFYDFVKAQDPKKLAEARVGSRVAYQLDWAVLASNTPPHGEWPFHICHIDHTELDIELKSSVTGNSLGRPWLTILIDAYSRRILAFVLWFDPPSYRTCMAIIDRCVRKHGRMPNTVMVDHGKEFESLYFVQLIEGFDGKIKQRPPAKARFGSICERMFGTTNTQFVHNLQGNTEIMKNVRQVTKEFNPKNSAAWTLESLTVALREYFYEVYDTTDHSALHMSPREAFERGLDRMGLSTCRPIPYNDTFRILSLPAPRNATVQLNRRSGLRVNRLDYWSKALQDPRLERKPIEVRYDPDDITVCYALVHNRWVTCHVRNQTLLRHWTEKQAIIAAKEIRQKGLRRQRALPQVAARLAEGISGLRDCEVFLAQQDKDRAKERATALLDGNATLAQALLSGPVEATEKIAAFSTDPCAKPPKRQRQKSPPKLKTIELESYGHM